MWVLNKRIFGKGIFNLYKNINLETCVRCKFYEEFSYCWFNSTSKSSTSFIFSFFSSLAHLTVPISLNNVSLKSIHSRFYTRNCLLIAFILTHPFRVWVHLNCLFAHVSGPSWRRGWWAELAGATDEIGDLIAHVSSETAMTPFIE